MKEKELRDNAICSVCEKHIGHGIIPLFWTVTVERHAVRDGLAAMFEGNAALLQGTDGEVTETVFGPVKLTVCANCAHKRYNSIHVAMESSTLAPEPPAMAREL